MKSGLYITINAVPRTMNVGKPVKRDRSTQILLNLVVVGLTTTDGVALKHLENMRIKGLIGNLGALWIKKPTGTPVTTRV